MQFYPYCLAADTSKADSNIGSETKEGTSDYRSYADLFKMTGVSQAPTIFKMDIEGFEYNVLLELLKSSPPETWPQQISMEVHWATRMIDLQWMLRTRTAAEMSLWFAVLFTVGGYLPVEREFFSVGCPSCMEVLLVRVVCSQQLSPGTE